MNSHPEYNEEEYKIWRLIKNGGEDFVEEYLIKREQESDTEFTERKDLTPDPGVAASAIEDVKNAFAPRMDVVRSGGHETYQSMVKGLLGGVDGKYTTQDDFLRSEILPELLYMGKVGVLVLNTNPPTVPYCRVYRAEDIWNWNYTGNVLTKLVLNEEVVKTDEEGLPDGDPLPIHRIFTLDGNVTMTITDRDDNPLNENLEPGEYSETIAVPEITMAIYEMPSLLRTIDRYQIAYLNLESSDLAWLRRANMTIYTEQGSSLDGLKRKKKEEDTEDQDTPKITIGDTIGRRYPPNMERPKFIAPPTDPIEVSMKKQKQIEDRIKDILKTKLSELKMASAESLTLRERGLEAGLSAIGSVLRGGDIKTAIFIHMYLGSEDYPTVSYPLKYELRTEADRLESVTSLKKMQKQIGPLTAKKEIEKIICQVILESRVPNQVYRTIIQEIDNSTVGIYDPEELNKLVDSGIISHELASQLIGAPPGDYEKAAEEHKERIVAIKQAQSTSGVPDESPDPTLDEKEKKNDS